MTSSPLVRRRLELGMGLRELGSRSKILLGALRDAERRDTIDHLTVSQVRRLCDILGIEPQELLNDSPEHASSPVDCDIHAELSDEALNLLNAIFAEESQSGSRSEIANCEQPNPAIAELLSHSALDVVDGFAVIDPRIAESLAAFG